MDGGEGLALLCHGVLWRYFMMTGFSLQIRLRVL
jgi:hypothetical protein